MNNGRTFPRRLTNIENQLLFSVLPERKSGYKLYRDKINSLLVIGAGRFGGGNFILGKEDRKPDISLPSSSVFAIGTDIYEEGIIDIIIHEEVDDEIEYDISFQDKNGLNKSIPDSLTAVKEWNYSEWNPGDNAPDDNSSVREINILDNKYLLAIAPDHKKIWLHEYESGVNFLIPVTNFYNELMRIINVSETKIALNPSSFFASHTNFADEELRSAFISYNRYLKRVNIKESIPVQQTIKNKKGFLSIFRKGGN
jgi:hypothetical protein